MTLEHALRNRIAQEPAGVTVSLSLATLDGASEVWIDADTRLHAASTMKVPVLLELGRRVDQGQLTWEDTTAVRNTFRSIVDGSAYALTVADDSDSSLYAIEGQAVSYRHLAERMIVRSSNLATNILIDRLGAPETQATARALGADSIEVLRGVEDIKAYRQGLSNTTTARDLVVLMAALARGQAASPESTAEMIRILEAQEFHDLIPTGLPEGTRVANKTGWITGIVHDAAIVYPDGCGAYVLVVLTRGYDHYEDAARIVGDLSRLVYSQVCPSRP